MNLVKKLINKLKSDSFVRIITELCIATLLFNVNLYLGLGLFFIVLLEVLFSKNNDNLLYIFIFMAINDEILVVDMLNGSISRIFLVLIALKLIIYIIKNKIKPNKMQIGITLFFIISCLVSLDNIKEEAIILINIFTFVLFSMALKFDKKNLDNFIYKLFTTIISSTFCGIIYGLVTFNYLEYNQGNKIIYRFNGSYEPNFMCLYINLAILSLLSIKDKVNKYLFYILCSILILSAILTISVTGLGVLLFSLFIYFIVYRNKWKIVLKDFFIIFLITGLLYGSLKLIKYEDIIAKHDLVLYIDHDNDKNNIYVQEKDEIINKITEKKYSDNALFDRLLRTFDLLKEGKIDEVTSGRTALIRDFYKASIDRPILNILFGNNPLNKKVYSPFFGHDCFSHNSYVDFLYNFGIIGLIIIMYFIIYRTFKNKFLGLSIKDSIYKNDVKIIRIMLMIFIFTLSMYTQRVLLLFFLL